jgi:N-succinyldiaminopimelate aminotransferase
MNPNLKYLQPYPFEKLTRLKQGISPPADKPHIALSLGEPKHAPPHFIQEAVLTHLHGLMKYPTTRGLPELRLAIATWLSKRFSILQQKINPETQVLPVNGTREALFSFAQCIIDPADKPLVIMPNPFYQIYEGAAILAGAEPYYLNSLASNHYLPDFSSIPEKIWQRCQLLYLCSPGNPTGSVINRVTHEALIQLAEKYDFVIAADECYSEIYSDENTPPPSLLKTAYDMGNESFKRCIIFQSLSKRSNVPGLRSGFVAGDAEILHQYFQYRTYHGCAMPLPTQHASLLAWQDEVHVTANRRYYREKFTTFIDILANVCTITQPPASFFIWLQTAIDDTEFARMLFQRENVTVLPGSYLSRDSNGINPGKDHVRVALVAPQEECIEAANRIKNFINSYIV